MPFFICPNCKNRSVDHDGYQGMTREAVACDRCGFGLLFELMDDYYPAPNAGVVVCDNQARVIACGRGLFELCGFPEEELIGRDVVEAFQLGGFEADRNPVALALEWGVRRLDEKLELTTRGGQRKSAIVDVFPAYDDDGGLLVAITPKN